MAQHKVNGYAVTAHKPYNDGFVILATTYNNGRYEYVVATMNDIDDPHWFSGYYTENIVSAINRYYEYADNGTPSAFNASTGRWEYA